MIPAQFDKTKWLLSRVRDIDTEEDHIVHSYETINLLKHYQDFEEHKSVIRLHKDISERDNSLIHYGVPGQKWGVITKEYEPVAVDQRKTRGFSPVAKIRSRIAERNARDRAELQQTRENRMARFAKNKKRMEIAGKVLAGAIVAISLYGAYKLWAIKRNRAYAGLLNSFLKKNPATAGNAGQLLKRGHHLAKANVVNDGLIKNAAGHLKRSGQYIRGKRANRIYKSGKLFERSEKIKISGPAFMKKLKNYRKMRLRSKVFDKLYF